MDEISQTVGDDRSQDRAPRGHQDVPARRDLPRSRPTRDRPTCRPAMAPTCRLRGLRPGQGTARSWPTTSTSGAGPRHGPRTRARCIIHQPPLKHRRRSATPRRGDPRGVRDQGFPRAPATAARTTPSLTRGLKQNVWIRKVKLDKELVAKVQKYAASPAIRPPRSSSPTPSKRSWRSWKGPTPRKRSRSVCAGWATSPRSTRTDQETPETLSTPGAP